MYYGESVDCNVMIQPVIQCYLLSLQVLQNQQIVVLQPWLCGSVDQFYASAGLRSREAGSQFWLPAARSLLQKNSWLNTILFYSILFYSIIFYSILFYSILFYSILFYSILFRPIGLSIFCQNIEICHVNCLSKAYYIYYGKFNKNLDLYNLLHINVR